MAYTVKELYQRKLFRCIKSMYNNAKTRVRCGTKLTEYVNSTAGMKQGDVCSPVFSLSVYHELALEVISKGRHGVGIMFDASE